MSDFISISRPLDALQVEITEDMIHQGRLCGWTGAELVAHSIKVACDRAGVDPGRIEVQANGHRAVIEAEGDG